LRKAGKAAGISKNVTPHIFRHSYGTHLYAATKDIHLVKRAMRHSDIKTTMAVYVKDTGASMAEAVAALPALAPRARLRSV
jgi:integrase/recombinase XerD